MTQKALTREEILAAQDLKTEWMPIPQWKGGVYIRSMTGEERAAMEDLLSSLQKKSVKGVMETIVSLCAVDEQGQNLFTAADIAALSRKNGAILRKIANKASDINALSEQDIEDLAGN